MSLATRCPACGTIFRVVQDQLKVSEGWVRCGQCHEVFHGIEALFDLDSDPAIAARRAARNVAAAPPPARVFAETRGSATGNIPTPESEAPTAFVPPEQPMMPTPTWQPPAAEPSSWGQATAQQTESGASATSAFTPAGGNPDAPAPIVPRSGMAPRFAARLAEESARAQATPTPSPIPSPFPEEIPASRPFGSVLAERTEPAWETPAASAMEPFYQGPVAPPQQDDAVPTPEGSQGFDAPAVQAQPAAAESIPADEWRSAPEDAAPPPAPAWPAPSDAELADSFAALPGDASGTPAPEAVAATGSTDEPVSDAALPLSPTDDGAALPVTPAPSTDAGGSIPPSMVAADADDEDDRAGPPTLASMLPEDAGEWPPRPGARKRRTFKEPSTAVAVIARNDPRFLREAKSGARWRKPRVRAILGTSLAVLVIAAVAQVAWPQRDTLAARWPDTLPAWTWLCEQAGCRIESPRAIASLALDGSSLTRTDTDHVLLFSADLHNRADHAVRMPSFDLTFMDLNGEIVARKVLSPAQIGIRQTALAPEAELHVHARIQVGSLDASGFQAEMFYP